MKNKEEIKHMHEKNHPTAHISLRQQRIKS